MFLLSCIFAASIDGFIIGFVLKGAGVNFGYKKFIRAFCIIFICCLAVTLPAVFLHMAVDQRYIGIFGTAVMLYMSYKSWKGDENENVNINIFTVSLSVGRDAAVVCLYLTLSGFDPVVISFISAFMHCVMLLSGEKLCDKLIKNKWEIYTRYISTGIFFIMAACKRVEIF